MDDIERAIRAKQNWILTKLFERSERRTQRDERAPVAWVDGAQLPYLGADITLRLEPAARSHCVYELETRTLRLGVTPGLEEWQIRERVKLWFQAEAKRLFGERLDLYAPRMGVSYSAFALSSAGTRWGSCTVAGNIRLEAGPLSAGAAGLRGGARTGAPARDEPQPGFLGRGGRGVPGLRWRQGGAQEAVDRDAGAVSGRLISWARV
jgi:hypothetical protein